MCPCALRWAAISSTTSTRTLASALCEEALRDDATVLHRANASPYVSPGFSMEEGNLAVLANIHEDPMVDGRRHDWAAIAYSLYHLKACQTRQTNAPNKRAKRANCALFDESKA